MKIYINAESVNDFGIENYFDENISLIGTGKHELFTNLHEFLESFKFDVKRRGKIRIKVRNLHQEEERLDDAHVLALGTVDFIGLFKDGSVCFKMETGFTIIYKWTNLNLSKVLEKWIWVLKIRVGIDVDGGTGCFCHAGSIVRNHRSL